MSEGEKTTLGLIGCGRAGAELHLPAISSIDGFRVGALCDADAAALSRVADRFGVPRTYGRFADLVDDDSIDLIAVCVPVAMRAELLGPVLESGKHVFLEKPLALDQESARQVSRWTKKATGKVFVGHNLRCHRLVERCRQQLPKIGDLESVCSIWTTDLAAARGLPAWRKTVASGGGVLYEMAVHHFDLIEWLVEDRLESVWCRQRSGTSELSAAAAVGATHRGILVTSVFSQESVPRNTLEFFGSKGRIELDLYRFDGFKMDQAGSDDGTVTSRARGLLSALTTLPQGVRLALKGGDYKLSYRRQWRRILGVLNGESDRGLCTPAEALRAVEVAAAGIESAQSGRSIVLTPNEAGPFRQPTE